ncbi:MAG: GntR family transcriptional regulator, partial [Sporichthyaceae bacterium]|nr:GntR family transcriptional regulator [Sporichthyaceae bacterium]
MAARPGPSRPTGAPPWGSPDPSGADPTARTLTEHALGAIRGELLAGRLEAGSRIHAEELATWLGMSPIPVREALRALASEGLVIALPQRGFRVPAVTLADLTETYRLRLVLDPMAVRLAVPKLLPERLAVLETTLESLRRSYDQDDWETTSRLHRQFHFGIYEAAGSPWLLRFLSMLWSNSERYQRLSAPHRGTREQRGEAHRRVLVACRERDAEGAAQYTHDHLQRTFETVSRLLEGGRSEAPAATATA